MKIGDIVRVGLGNTYYVGVLTEINDEEEMCVVKDLSQVEDNIQPLRCVREVTAEEMADELRHIYGYYK